MKFHEHIHRSIAKAITFRTLIIFSDAIIVFLITRRFDITIGVLIFSNLASTIIYIFHERLWNRVHWGKVKNQKIW